MLLNVMQELQMKQWKDARDNQGAAMEVLPIDLHSVRSK